MRRKESNNVSLDFQNYSLQHVSRTFALTIPVLPISLRDCVGNAYLLCRIADTIEDDQKLNSAQKKVFLNRFAACVKGDEDSALFASELEGALSEDASFAEKELVAHFPDVLSVTQFLLDNQKTAICECIDVMTKGMGEFAGASLQSGLNNLEELESYCYFVAGVVGEMLTRFFCECNPLIMKNKDSLLKLSVSFGQGLQMTNILKDVWRDQKRGVCWLPRDIFEKHGCDLKSDLCDTMPSFKKGMDDLVAIAHFHLQKAFDYILLIPKKEQGIRKFCLWALAMALQTLHKIHETPEYKTHDSIKISRSQVKRSILTINMIHMSNKMLRAWFYFGTRSLPMYKEGLASGVNNSFSA